MHIIYTSGYMYIYIERERDISTYIYIHINLGLGSHQVAAAVQREEEGQPPELVEPGALGSFSGVH